MLLSAALSGAHIPEPEEARPIGSAPDDVLDALVALWTAERSSRGDAERIPAEPPVDLRGRGWR
jgi:predicted RNase H-like nuclease